LKIEARGNVVQDSARICAVDPPYDPTGEAQLAKWMPPGSDVEPLKLFRTLVVHDDLASRMRPLGAGILAGGLVDPIHREVMIHRSCARCQAEYEWGVHAVAFGLPLGLTDEQLYSTVHGGPHDSCWSRSEGAVVRLADELHDSGKVSDDLFAELSVHFDTRQQLELAVIAGWYHTISFVVGLARIPLEDWAARFPSATC
jgi:alkylhydroperoxidase family enzyme